MGAECNDGSKYKYYFRSALDPSQSKTWVIYLGGGDLCWVGHFLILEDYLSCLYRQKTSPSKMTSNGLAEYQGGEGILSPDPLANPHFWGANQGVGDLLTASWNALLHL